MSLGSRMKERRESLGMTQVQLADLLGVTKGAIGNYETGANSPKASIMYKVFEILKCDANYLYQDEMKELETDDFTVSEIKMVKKYRVLDEHGKKVVDIVLDEEYKYIIEARKEASMQEVPRENIVSRFYIPEYREPASAGTGQPIGMAYPETIALIKEPPKGTSFITHVHGDSMEPKYEDGDIVFVKAQREIRIGQIGVFFMDGEEFIKELGDGELISHNSKYEPIALDESIRCQGLVLGICDESYFFAE